MTTLDIAATASNPPARPALAALKSLALPGLGQWHNGEINKAAWCFLAFAFVSVPAVALIALHLPPALTAPALALSLLLALGLWLGSAVEAWRAARRAARLAGAPARGGSAAGATPVWRMNGVTVLLIVLCDFIALPLLIGTVRGQQVQPFRIPSASMTPTLWPGDFVFADMRYGCVACRQPVRRGDVAIFANPNDRTLLYVKRVVALPGDRVQVDGDSVRVNGVPVPEAQGAAPPDRSAPATAAGPMQHEPTALPAPTDITVPPGRIYALGDHRSASVDSRQFGTVPLQDVVGRVRQVWFSWGEGGVRWSRLGQTVQ
jgi:signal peptidase I